MKYLIIILYCLIHLPTSAAQQKSPNEVFVTGDVWCPYTCEDDAKNRGLLTEVAEQAFSEVGLQTFYFSSSWNRAVSNVKKGKHDILLGANTEQARDYELYTDYYIEDVTVFATLKDASINITQGAHLTPYRIGKVEEYDYDETGVWEPYIQEHPNVINVTSIRGEEHLLDLLLRNRIAVAVMNRDVASFYTNHKNLTQIHLIKPNISSRLFLGFNRSERGLMLREKFREGVKVLMSKNRLAPIYEKYQIPMPEFDLQ